MDSFSIPLLARELASEADAYEFLEELRWQSRPVCPHCGSLGVWLKEINTRRLWDLLREARDLQIPLTALGERGIVNATLIEAAARPPALPFRSPCPGRKLDEAALTSALRDLFVARRAASSEGTKLSGDVASLAPLPQLPDEKAFFGIAPVG